MSQKQELLFLENQLCFPLYAASRLTTKVYAPFLKELDITYPQYLVLLVLWKHNSQTVNEIGNQLYLESNTLTPLLKRMEQKGLLSRVRSAEDERQVNVTITEDGKLLRNKAEEIPLKITESLAGDSISETELNQFKNNLYNVIELLSEKLK